MQSECELIRRGNDETSYEQRESQDLRKQTVGYQRPKALSTPREGYLGRVTTRLRCAVADAARPERAIP